MDVRGLKRDVERGSVSLEQLLEVIEKLDRRLRRVEQENSRLRHRLGQYEPEVLEEEGSAEEESGDGPSRYSVADEKRRRGHRPPAPKRRGRISTAEKLSQSDRIESLYPDGARPQDCQEVTQRVVWRIENGQAVRVGYRVHRGPDGVTAKVADVLPRGEFDVQIVLAVAYLTYILRISLDQVCELMRFFWKLPLSKSQADALLNQLSRGWESEFNRLCQRLAVASVVCTDETGWMVGSSSSNAAVFATPSETVLLFDCVKGRTTLEKLLPPEVFDGVLVSDDHASYQGLAAAQKCWAHLLRKAIKLSLLYPHNRTYREFLDELLAIYRDADRRRRDKRLGEVGRRRLVETLGDRTRELCYPHCWGRRRPARTPHRKAFELLANELFRLVEIDELFTFVLHPDVPGTNNESERLLRGPAQARKLNRTSKSSRGAHRRSVITSVLESLRKNVTAFTLDAVRHVVLGASETGQTLFDTDLRKQRHASPSAFSPG